MIALSDTALIDERIVHAWDQFQASQVAYQPLFEKHRSEILSLWALSPFAERISRQYPDALIEALKDSGQCMGRNQYTAQLQTLSQDVVDEIELQHVLRKFRQRHYLRICLRDLILNIDILEIIAELSALADASVTVASEWAFAASVEKYGVPTDAKGNTQSPLIIALGKLGGYELNFSSDIDIMFCFPRTGQTTGGQSVANQEFFIHHARTVIRLLADVTEDGFVFRVDTRLRPFGDSGALTANLQYFEDYYQTHGREWERYALIKARVIVGDEDSTEAFTHIITPFVYRRYIDFSVIDTIREMKRMIRQQVERKSGQGNIKLGYGGIREIEFIAQVFQLIHGGKQESLRVNRVVLALKHLGEQASLPKEEVEQLLSAYRFFRRVENRLQMVNDQQTHQLPKEELAQKRLAAAMGYEDWTRFYEVLAQHREQVAQAFARVMSRPDEAETIALSNDWLSFWDELESLPAAQWPEEIQVLETAQANTLVSSLLELKNCPSSRQQDQAGRARFRLLIPELVQELLTVENPTLVLQRLSPLLKNIMRRSAYMVLLAENPGALRELVLLAQASPWISNHLAAYPLLLDELLSPEALYAAVEPKVLTDALQSQLAGLGKEDYETALERVRHFKHAQTLRIAAADRMGSLPLMKVSDHLSWLAEAIVQSLIEYLHTFFPDYGLQQHFAVIAYGKLGGLELSYGSDLDLVFVSDWSDLAMADVEKRNWLETHIPRVAQKLVQMLTLQTVSGKLYEVDVRLRPYGASGPIVTKLDGMHQYYLSQAWTWEYQALVRARCIAGSPEFQQKFNSMRVTLLAQERDAAQLLDDVCAMRAKMIQSQARHSPDRFDLKHDRGGVTDIEFMVQYAVLAHAAQVPEICTYSDNVRLLEGLAGSGFLQASIADEMTSIYCRYRDRLHRLALQSESSQVAATELQAERAQIERFWAQLMKQ